jgi:hypothetical protein
MGPSGFGRIGVRRRLALMVAVSAAGGLAFLPFLAAGSGKATHELLGFPVAVMLIAGLAAWPGLRAADAAGLPMPLLRRLDGGPRSGLGWQAVAVTLSSCALLGIAGAVVLRVVDAPALPGDTSARALSTVFAAGPLEIVLHLCVMSVTVWMSRRRWVGIVVAALALVAFHLTGGPAPTALLVATIAANGAIGLVLGILYAAYGFELVMLGHATAHLLTLLL